MSSPQLIRGLREFLLTNNGPLFHYDTTGKIATLALTYFTSQRDDHSPLDQGRQSVYGKGNKIWEITKCVTILQN